MGWLSVTDRLKMADKWRQPRQSMFVFKRDGKDTVSAADTRIHLQKSQHYTSVRTVWPLLHGRRLVAVRLPAENKRWASVEDVSYLCHVPYTYSIETAVTTGVQHKFRERSWLHMKRIFMALPRYHHYVILSKWPQHMNDVRIHHKNIKLEAIQMDRVNYLHDVPTHALGSENTYLHEGELQFMYKRYGVYHFIVKWGPLWWSCITSWTDGVMSSTLVPVQVVLHFRYVVPTELHPFFVDTYNITTWQTKNRHYTHWPLKILAWSFSPASSSTTAVLVTTSGGFVSWIPTKRLHGSVSFNSSTSCSVTIFSWYSVDNTTWTWQTLPKHLYGSAQYNLVLSVWGRHVLFKSQYKDCAMIVVVTRSHAYSVNMQVGMKLQ